ncbi:MAG: DAK2 domain-containing protein, partial [Acidimicrobiales bacterium]
EVINNLNVYPVPDGDTGTNMSLTMQSVVQELADADDDLDSVCHAISHGSLMGARGNSGVILSQILRGLVGVLRERPPAGSIVVAEALAAATTGAYGAVMKPVEGTILTVVREASEAAAAAVEDGADLVGTIDSAHRRAADALARTPEMLPVLAEAGVVDSGGSGLLLLFDAALAELDGRAMPEPDPTVKPLELLVDPTTDSGDGGSIADLRYEVMYLLAADDDDVPGFKEAWSEIGDSIVVVGGEGVWNCHVHTDDIGAAIEAGIEAGRPSRIRVTDLLEEVEERDWVREAIGEPAPVEVVPCAVVAVGVGPGVDAIFTSMGVHQVVAGGQSMNPSTADLLAVVESVPGEEVVILPNNKNIIPVAEQVDAASSRTVRVVATRSVPEGIGCLMAYDPRAGAEQNADAMTAAAAEVVACELTRAVRASTSPVGPIAEGDWLGLCRDGICAVEDSLVEAATSLLATMIDADHELLTVIVGADVDEAVTEAIERYVRHHNPDVEIEVHEGGQPLYPYYFGLE